MSDLVIVALVACVPATLTSIASLVATLRHSTKIDEYKHEVNSRMDELLRITREKARADGRAEGIESERVRMPDTPHVSHP